MAAMPNGDASAATWVPKEDEFDADMMPDLPLDIRDGVRVANGCMVGEWGRKAMKNENNWGENRGAGVLTYKCRFSKCKTTDLR